MKWRRNPLYRPTPRWELRGRALWLWRGLLLIILGAWLIAGKYVGAGVFAGLWVVAEGLEMLREKRSGGT